MLPKKWRFISLGVLLGALLVTGSRAAEGGINSWTSNGPNGVPIRALAIDPVTPATLYAGTDAGLFKSTNGGGSWSAVNTGLNQIASVLAVDPQTPTTLYAGTAGGVFKSTDGGGSWSAVNTGLPNYSYYYLSIDPPTARKRQAQATLYVVGTRFAGVYKSTNGGGSWSAVNTDLPNYRMDAMA